jgi:hypothetical protein
LGNCFRVKNQKKMANFSFMSLTIVMSLWCLFSNQVQANTPPVIGGCNIFPSDNWWNTPINTLPVHKKSKAWVKAIGAKSRLKADFGACCWDGSPIGIPFVTVPSSQPAVPINFVWYPEESDAGPYPVPNDAPVEGGGDKHVLVLQQGTCQLYELYAATYNGDGSWNAGSGAKWDLSSNSFRPLGWTSADAAGLPILPGLVRYDEILAGEIRHAIRITAPNTLKKYQWPATHLASNKNKANLPPMGARFRLKASFDISGFPDEIRIILQALKTYGAVLADNGSPWYMSGAPDDRWSNDMLNEQFSKVLGSNMEAVDVSSLMVSADSGQVK